MNFASKIPVLRSFARAYALTKFKKEWRKRNKQNQTVPMNPFPMESRQRYIRRVAYLELFSSNREIDNRKLCIISFKRTFHFKR